MNFTPGPWVWGRWTILPEDRVAQCGGEPFWTLAAGDEDLCVGPIGRKSLKNEVIIWTQGFECEGIDAMDADKRLIAAAPEMYEALTSLVKAVSQALAGSNMDSDALAKLVIMAIAALGKAEL